MTNLRAFLKKSWVFITAAVLIAGSCAAMVFALNRNVPANVSANISANIAPTAAPAAAAAADADSQSQIDKAAAEAQYTVIDLSKEGAERQKLIREKLSRIPDITSEQIEKKYNEIMTDIVPGDKDITAAQAAAYAAHILKKAYKVDFKGYTAEASFSRNPVPGTDSWTVIFRSPEAADNNEQRRQGKTFIASVNSVDGTMLDASFIDPHYSKITEDLHNPAWVEKAEQDISVLLPENISIKSSKIVAAHPGAGVTVVCELSNGSAYGVRLYGKDKEAASYVFFPHGYDGSLDINPVKLRSVG